MIYSSQYANACTYVCQGDDATTKYTEAPHLANIPKISLPLKQHSYICPIAKKRLCYPQIDMRQFMCHSQKLSEQMLFHRQLLW